MCRMELGPESKQQITILTTISGLVAVLHSISSSSSEIIKKDELFHASWGPL
jgi:hypothetical protein